MKKQHPEGKWMLNGDFPDKSHHSDVAGTAFGLLPFLAAGKTHEKSDGNEYDQVVANGLSYLLRKQDRKTGNFGGGMYAHALATIAVCEAYGLSNDPGMRQSLRQPAELAVKYIVDAQHSAGGWRYSPRQEGDMSVAGWQVMALKMPRWLGPICICPTTRFKRPFNFSKAAAMRTPRATDTSQPGIRPRRR